MVKIKFIKTKKEFHVPSGCEFLEIAAKHPEMPLKFSCKRGDCGTCCLNIVNGMENLTKISPLEQETLRKKNCTINYRLACQCAVNGPIDIDA